MRFICYCVLYNVSVYVCIVVCRGSLTGLEVGCGWSVSVNCCSLLVRCANSAMGMDGLAVDSNWVSHSWSCWKCSCNSARSCWGLKSTLFSGCFTILFGYTMGEWCIFQCSSVVGSRHVLSFIIHKSLISLSQCHAVFCCIFFNCGAEPLVVLVCGYGTSACGSVIVWRMGQNVTYQAMAVLSIIVSQLNPVSCQLVSVWSMFCEGTVSCSTVRSLIM